MKKIILLFFIFPNYTSAQEFRCFELDNLNSFDNWSVLRDDFEKHQILLIGEAPHIMPANTYLQTELLIYLNSNFDLKHALIEWGNAEAFLINKFLETGDSAFFNKSFYDFTKFLEAQDAFQKLYEYNQNLEDEKKIKFTGLDFEREPALTSSIC